MNSNEHMWNIAGGVVFMNGSLSASDWAVGVRLTKQVGNQFNSIVCPHFRWWSGWACISYGFFSVKTEGFDRKQTIWWSEQMITIYNVGTQLNWIGTQVPILVIMILMAHKSLLKVDVRHSCRLELKYFFPMHTCSTFIIKEMPFRSKSQPDLCENYIPWLPSCFKSEVIMVPVILLLYLLSRSSKDTLQ